MDVEFYAKVVVKIAVLDLVYNGSRVRSLKLTLLFFLPSFMAVLAL
jgi:hypothetical protein